MQSSIRFLIPINEIYFLWIALIPVLTLTPQFVCFFPHSAAEQSYCGRRGFIHFLSLGGCPAAAVGESGTIL